MTIMDAVRIVAQEHIADTLDLFGEHFVMEAVERWIWDRAQDDLAGLETMEN